MNSLRGLRPALKPLVLVFVLVEAAACASVCTVPRSATASVGDLVPGEYRLLLTATDGSRLGRQARGKLWLHFAPNHWSETKLYGRVAIDLAAVGAPVVRGVGPDPNSDDPQAPGVLVDALRHDNHTPREVPVLTIGTDSNANPIKRRPDGTEVITMTLDGPGVALWVYRASAEGFVGRWSEWGLVVDGSGVFCAVRASTKRHVR